MQRSRKFDRRPTRRLPIHVAAIGAALLGTSGFSPAQIIGPPQANVTPIGAPWAGCPLLMNRPQRITPDRSGALPADRMQVVAYYDGNIDPLNLPLLSIEVWNPTTQLCCTIDIELQSNSAIDVREYSMVGFEPTGEFTVSNVIPNGAVDGIAFGLYSRDASGDRWLLHSRAPGLAATTANFIGAWPLGLSEATWDARLPAGLGGSGYDGFVARRQAQATLSGAQLLPNGVHTIPTGRIAGDLNGDGCVDDDDILEWEWYLNFGQCSGPVGGGSCNFPQTPFSSDRFNALPLGRMQVVAFYDGDGGAAMLEIEMYNPATGQCCWLPVFVPTNSDIVAVEFDATGWEPTGVVNVSGVVANGMIDGIAYAIYRRDAATGDRSTFKSRGDGLAGIVPNFAGGWPVAWSMADWDLWMATALGLPAQSFERRQAQAALSGAQLLGNGLHLHPASLAAMADVNRDGVLDGFDIAHLISLMGAGCCP